jgi:broad specificity phosphatase PhoE
MFGDQAKLWLVRHAEKEPGPDPVLTGDGNRRAGDLFRALKDKRIQRIYATEYKRTQHTGDSLRIQSGIEMIQYKADTTGEDLLKKIIEHNDLASSILIIGHSNTIPKLIQKLGLTDYPPRYKPDAEYDNLFLLEFKDGKAFLRKLKFGASSGASATMQ